jgi:hypothetical protein
LLGNDQFTEVALADEKRDDKYSRLLKLRQNICQPWLLFPESRLNFPENHSTSQLGDVLENRFAGVAVLSRAMPQNHNRSVMEGLSVHLETLNARDARAQAT